MEFILGKQEKNSEMRTNKIFYKTKGVWWDAWKGVNVLMFACLVLCVCLFIFCNTQGVEKNTCKEKN